jgi:murein DD-endopeptidase MepM/ murein hydrolase activator NlpD
VSRGIAHLVVVGVVAFTAAQGISAARSQGAAPPADRAENPSAFSFNFVAPARAAAGDQDELRTTTFELVPDPNSSDPVLSRRAARFAPSPPPTPLPTPVAPPAPAAEPVAPTQVSVQPPAVVGTGALHWPLAGGTITTYFSSWHPAVDIAAPYGTSVIAADSGVVTWAGWRSNGGGYVVEIDHGNGMKTRANHLGTIWVSAGQAVSRGQGIGSVGCTGICTGPHVHFEVIVGGVNTNPLRYL